MIIGVWSDFFSLCFSTYILININCLIWIKNISNDHTAIQYPTFCGRAMAPPYLGMTIMVWRYF